VFGAELALPAGVRIAVEWATVTAGLIVAGIVVIAGIAFALRWRSSSDEQHALRHYQHALDTLRTVSDRLESTRSPEAENNRTMREPAGPAPESRPASVSRPVPASRSVRTTSSRVVPARSGSDSEIRTDPGINHDENGNPGPGSMPGGPHEPAFVFEDDEASSTPLSGGAPTMATSNRVTRQALQRSSKPPSRVPAVMFLMLVAILIVVGVVVVLQKNHHTTAPTVHTNTPTTTHQTKTTTQTTTPTTSPPSSTVPQTLQAEPASVTPQGATYAAPNVPYSVDLSSSGACWVYATLESTGAVVWTGVLEAGQSQTLSASGQMDIKFGHANSVAVTMNGIPVAYPSPYNAVFMMQFVPQST
jgi:type II secretory pathway pseudopilin PulG